jgi:hypothetical protein
MIFSGFCLFLPISNSPSTAAGRSSCIESGSFQTDRVEKQYSLRNRRENVMSNRAALDVSQEGFVSSTKLIGSSPSRRLRVALT